MIVKTQVRKLKMITKTQVRKLLSNYHLSRKMNCMLEFETYMTFI